jgi:hypothetical protein
MSIYIDTLSDEVQSAIDNLREERGEFSLAMLYNDGIATTGWNVIIAARWADELGRAEAIRVVIQALSERLGEGNKQAISRITVLPTNDAFVEAVTSVYQVNSPGARQWLQNVVVAGIPIGLANILYSRR